MKDDVTVKVPNEISKILIVLDGVANCDGVLNCVGMLEGDHLTHFLGWIKRLVAQSSVWKMFICK
jgi:hypothetical protein